MALKWYLRRTKDQITYWTPSSVDKWGTRTWNTPVTLSGRWEKRLERFVLADGEETVSNALVFLNDEVVVAGYVFPGASTASDPKEVSGAYPIRRSDKIPGFRSEEYVYKAYL
jgi:hypothetical protein